MIQRAHKSEVSLKKFLKHNSKININDINVRSLGLYPPEIQRKLKLNDVLNIGFENLKNKKYQNNKKNILAKVISSGYLENNKGIHLENRRIKLKCLTNKDINALEIV